jgi:hypothetical protein
MTEDARVALVSGGIESWGSRSYASSLKWVSWPSGVPGTRKKTKQRNRDSLATRSSGS